MKQGGWEGLASAVVLQACKDYITYKRWMLKHAVTTGDATKRIEALKRDRKYCINHKLWAEAREAAEEMKTLKAQANHERKINDVLDFFHSEYFSNICTIDPEILINGLDEKIPDLSFNIAYEDFN